MNKKISGLVTRDQGGPLRYWFQPYYNRYEELAYHIYIKSSDKNDPSISNEEWLAIYQKLHAQQFPNGNSHSELSL